MPSVAWINGRVVPWSEAVLPIEDRGLQFGESLYEVLPVTRGRARLLDQHTARMRDAAETLGLAHGVPDRAAWEQIARQLLDEDRLDEGLLYAQLTGGVIGRSHLPDAPPSPTFFAYVRPLRFPRAADAERGIRAITLADNRWGHCDLKTTMLLPAVLARREAAKRNAEEALLLGPDGHLREGTSSNAFVVENGRVTSPRPTHHVLPGVTRPLVASLAAEAGYRVEDDEIDETRLRDADEVFVTSTSRLVMPVTVLDDRAVGNGKPGPVALEFARLLRRRLDLD